MVGNRELYTTTSSIKDWNRKIAAGKSMELDTEQPKKRVCLDENRSPNRTSVQTVHEKESEEELNRNPGLGAETHDTLHPLSKVANALELQHLPKAVVDEILQGLKDRRLSDDALQLAVAECQDRNEVIRQLLLLTVHPGHAVHLAPAVLSVRGAAPRTPPLAIEMAPERTSPGARSDVSVVKIFLDWLDGAYPPLEGQRTAGRPPQRCGFEDELQFVGRSSLIADCLSLLQRRFNERLNRNKEAHPVGVLGGASGIGKTRSMKELITHLEKFAEDNELPWVAPILITYNDGQPSDTDKTLGAPLAFALRILYFAFRQDLGKLSFHKWVDQVLRIENCSSLNPRLAVEIIQAVMDARNSDRRSGADAPGLIYIAVDETNRLLIDAATDDRQYRSLLKNTMLALDSVLKGQADIFVFAATAGVTIAPLELVFRDSGVMYEFFRMELLDWEAIMLIMETLEQRDAQWQGWQSDTLFVRQLVDYGTVPRLAAVLLKACRESLHAGARWGHLPYATLRRTVDAKVIAPDRALALQLIEDTVLATPVQREFKVLPSHSWTYQELESLALVVLTSSAHPRVQLIRPVFDHLLVQALKVKPRNRAIQMLREAVDILPVDPRRFVWQDFERFSAHFEAAKEMMWHARKQRRDSDNVSIQEFYGAGAIHLAGADAEVQLLCSPNVEVRPCKERFSGAPDVRDCDNYKELEWRDPGIIFVNADGAAFDTFRCRQKMGGGLLLVAGQQKLYLSCALSLDDVKEEAEKTRKAVSELRSVVREGEMHAEDSDHLLVIFATRAAPELLAPQLPDDFPRNCLLLTGTALRQYFGTVLSDRAFVALSNMVAAQTLRSTRGLGEKHSK